MHGFSVPFNEGIMSMHISFGTCAELPPCLPKH